MTIVYIILVLSLPVVFFLGYKLAYFKIESKFGNAKAHAEKIISDAQKEVSDLKKDIEFKRLEEEKNLTQKLAQKEQVLLAKIDKKKDELENNIDKRKSKIHEKELKLRDHENDIKVQFDNLDARRKELKSKEQSIEARKKNLEEKEAKLDEILEKELKKLEYIAGLSKEQALEELKMTLISTAKDNVAKKIKEINDEVRETADKKSKEIIISAIQRSAVDHSTDTTVSVVNLPNDDIKGRIIGREGRNIRAFEQATGIELIVDDTPEAVVISGFDPFRREIAKNALEKLIEDGRVHPGKIEEIVTRSKKEMEAHIKELGEEAAMQLNVHNLHPELVKLVGRLHYRTSYGQNVLLHSIEVAKVAGLMAADLGYDQRLAVRAGLLHDIGKAVDQYQEGTHVELGIELARKYKENKVVINAIASHHENYPVTHPISSLIMTADAISASRPGARRETLGNYLQRLEKLEALPMEFEGVTKSYAIQAGREIRVLVENNVVDDARAEILAADIAEKVQNEMKYPGHIKITVIREYRASGIAK